MLHTIGTWNNIWTWKYIARASSLSITLIDPTELQWFKTAARHNLLVQLVTSNKYSLWQWSPNTANKWMNNARSQWGSCIFSGNLWEYQESFPLSTWLSIPSTTVETEHLFWASDVVHLDDMPSGPDSMPSILGILVCERTFSCFAYASSWFCRDVHNDISSVLWTASCWSVLQSTLVRRGYYGPVDHSFVCQVQSLDFQTTFSFNMLKVIWMYWRWRQISSLTFAFTEI